MKEKRVLNEEGRIFYKSLLFLAIITYFMYTFSLISVGYKIGFFNSTANSIGTIFIGIYGICLVWLTINIIKKLKVK